MVMTTSMMMDYPGLYRSPWKMKYCRGQKISFNLLNSSRSKKIKENQCLRQNFQLEEKEEEEKEEELTYIKLIYMLLETHIQNFSQSCIVNNSEN